MTHVTAESECCLSCAIFILTYNGNWAGYWSSFSFWVMLATYSFKVRSPRTQLWASTSQGHTRSRLFLAPLKTTVKHWFSCTDPDRRLSASDLQPSRTHSTSVTATGRDKKSSDTQKEKNVTVLSKIHLWQEITTTHGAKQLKVKRHVIHKSHRAEWHSSKTVKYYIHFTGFSTG